MILAWVEDSNWKKATLAVDAANGKRAVVPIPAGDIVKVVVNPGDENNMVDVLWNSGTVAMYAEDLKQRSIETLSP